MAVVQEISQASQLEVNVTFYPQEMALIREKRTAFLKLGSNKLLIKDVPSSVLMDSFLFQPVPPSPSIKILEYNFQGPDITRETLLKHSIGQAVNILSQTTSQIPSNGKLLSVDGENAILDAQGTIFSVPKNQIIFPHLPYTLVAEPMITLKLMNAKEGDYQFDLGYLAKGFSWDAGYTIIVATDGSALDLNSWLTIHNTSRMNIKKGHFRIAQQRGFFYDIERPISLPDKAIKNILWFSARNLKPILSYRIYPKNDIIVDEEGLVMKPRVETWLSVKNTKDQGLGIVFPKGTMQVFRRNADGTLFYIGENKTSLTPLDQFLSLRVGSTKEITTEMRQTDYRKLGTNVVESGYRLDLKNTTDIPKRVTVFQDVLGEWVILRETHPHEEEDKRISWTLDIPARDEVSLRYRIRMNVK
ncbi:MAG TPA: hypothetical protein DEP85_00815 [Holosporales bacterium]|nr:MAG: hypothetical protein A3H46_04070 [Alphaproteobacteria bacterium RIFCSPLOWO2_02_FULL_43_54]HBW25074.1 hypothetical protein [Holosporales bacterium]HCC24042.1 hypothetical protein [Holosporales bacterium]